MNFLMGGKWRRSLKFRRKAPVSISATGGYLYVLQIAKMIAQIDKVNKENTWNPQTPRLYEWHLFAISTGYWGRPDGYGKAGKQTYVKLKINTV